jgi:hypothetical protein
MSIDQLGVVDALFLDLENDVNRIYVASVSIFEGRRLRTPTCSP